MAHLDYPDQFHLSAAVGWLELGNIREARNEALKISTSGRNHHDALTVSWELAARSEEWTMAHEIASVLTTREPSQPLNWICLSYSLYRLNRPMEAWMELVIRATQFPKDWSIPYLLACYAAKMGNSELSLRFLDRSKSLGGPHHVDAGLPARFLSSAGTTAPEPAATTASPAPARARADFTLS